MARLIEPICRGMAEAQLAEHHVLLWGRSPADPLAMEAQARASCRQWLANKVAGVFFAPLELSGHKDAVNARIAELFESAGIPLVLIDRDFVIGHSWIACARFSSASASAGVVLGWVALALWALFIIAVFAL